MDSLPSKTKYINIYKRICIIWITILPLIVISSFKIVHANEIQKSYQSFILLDTSKPITNTNTIAATAEISPTIFYTEPNTFLSYLPNIQVNRNNQQEELLFCNTLNPPLKIPDGDPIGVKTDFYVDDPRRIADMNIRIEISHTWIGDLKVLLTHQQTGQTIVLFDRPGYPNSELGCGNDGIGAIFDDEISLSAENQCYSGSKAIAGIYQPQELLSLLEDEILFGTWTLELYDYDEGDTGTLKSWCIEATVGPYQNEPIFIPPPDLPVQFSINNISGHPQSLPLDCESRSAVDWANYFDVYIDEIQFFNRLPKSDDPDSGFVGDVYGAWGQIPPNPYGVHAEPVATLLRKYGLNAYAHRPLSWDQVKSEIALKRPVIVWVVGSANRNEVPIYYTANNNHRSIVAAYEHTVILIGYSENSVTILDGANKINRALNLFLSSWSALDNMAITLQP